MIRSLVSGDQNCLMPLLEAFLSVDYVARLRRLLEAEPDDTPTLLQNILSLPPSIHKAFRAGYLDIRTRTELGENPPPIDEEYLDNCGYGLRRLYPDEISGLYLGDGTRFQNIMHYFQLSTPDPKHLFLPSNFLINVHFRFATALHLFYIEVKVARGWPRKSIGLSLPQRVRSGLCWLWLRLPKWLRVSTYMLLNRIGRKLYPLEASVWAQRLPFGCVPIQEVCHLMSYAERDGFANDIKDCVEQLRKLPNFSPYLICNSLGGAITDHRIPGDTGGPFKTETEFNDHLSSHLRHFYFTHSDFHPTNLLVERGRLSAIVDWESAGFRPEYWEFAKAMYGTMGGGVMGDIFWRAFGPRV
ncbi:uncharacterized protein APUU_50168A [Aspergillus puulaauensis]|uniref:Aminoglycoside phosphotransferase domain-containing protein n=1 Tax=Aspergillus puulaauensis TaxID=1220207 RepID=A0A7R7XQC5_9EURO|nr:uncharacterized protein APUU_50168A [Aspergillus puulaauensis]BCS25457.1 hypothetical protein APUU_50168A [Aspergillus puulaauensis]